MVAYWSRLLFLIIIVVCCHTLSLSQDIGSSSITGNVTDSISGDTLPYVYVKIMDSKISSYTNSKGIFILEGLSEGVYDIELSYVGYRTKRLSKLKVIQNQTLNFDIGLSQSYVMMEDVVVTASRKEQTVKMAAASVAVIGAKEFNRKNIPSFDYAFGNIPGIQVTRSSNANVQAFSIRGSSEVAGGGVGNRVLLLIDGRPALSPESGGALWNLVPTNSIQRIEVVKGAYSSLYGSSAMGGVVNVITKEHTLKPQLQLHLNYGFYEKPADFYNYSKYNHFYQSDFNYSRTIGKLSFLLDGGYASNDGHKENSAFKKYHFFGRTKYMISDDKKLIFTFNVNSILNDSPATWLSRTEAYSVAEYKKDDIQKRKDYNVDLFYSAFSKNNNKFSSRLYYYLNSSDYLFKEDENIDNDKQFVDKENIYAERFGNITQYDFSPFSKHSAIVGIDTKVDFVSGTPDSILYGDHNIFRIGAYIQDEISFSEKLIATLGVRYDYFNIKSTFSNSNISPKLAMVYHINKKISLRSLFAQAFRDPSVAERFIKFAQGSGLKFDQNPTLKSEKLNLSSELGINYQILDNLTFDMALFHNRYKNLIYFQAVSFIPLTYKVVNLSKAINQGVELSIKLKPTKFTSISTSYTYLDAKDNSSNRKNDFLAYKIKHSFSFAAHGYHKGVSLSISGRYNDKVSEVFLYPGSEPKAYFLLNTKIGYKINSKQFIYFALDNLTNTQYEQLERYRMPGRSFTFGYKLSWM